MFSVYIIQNKINNKLYVGKAKEPHIRFGEHKNIASGSKAKSKEFRTIHAAIKKYGSENFDFTVIEEWEDELDAYEAEKFWIIFFNSKISGYNETWGGEGVGSGENNPMYGKHHTDSAKAAMSQKRRGKLNPNYGKKPSENTITLMSIAKNSIYNGEKNPKAKLTNANASEIRRLYDTGNLSINELADSYSVKRSVIERILRNETYKEINK